MDATIYSTAGKEVGKVELPEGVFGLPWNADLVHQVAVSLASSKRKPVAHTKDRSEVRGGGKKPWRQKGTGRARHGSTRSPIWVGGGVTHGPRNEKNFEKVVSKKMKAKALFTILSQKYRDGEVLFIDSFALSEPKTREAVKTLSSLSSIKGFENILSKKRNSATIALSSKNKETERSFANLGNMEVLEVRNLHPLTLLSHKFLVIENPKEALEALPGKKLGVKKASVKKPVAKTAK
ncbi:MAG: 50S ribosomal protein L4 [Parcubacteria group bacterium]